MDRLRSALLLVLPVALLLAAVPPASAAPQLRVGNGSSCVLTDAATVKCWGSNNYGQVGNGAVGGWSVAPTDVVRLSGVVDLAVSGTNACAVISGGTVKCWGDNSFGTLGVGPGLTASSGTPLTIGGISGASKVTVGGNGSACAIVTGGVVRCWGYNLAAALGVGSVDLLEIVPANVIGIAGGATDVSHDGRHGCAVVTGSVRCWGYNDNNSISSSATVSYNSSQAVAGLISGASQVESANGNTCVLASSGLVRCFGRGDYGRIGNGSNSNQDPPGAVAIASGATSLSLGQNHACALVGASAKCWGLNYYGQIGTADDEYSYNSPVTPVGLDSGVTQVDAGGNNSCAFQGGAAKCWGAQGNGSNGDGVSESNLTPTTVVGLPAGVTDVATGAHSCAINSGTTLRCWGANNAEQLGDGTTNFRWQPWLATEINAVGNVGQVATNSGTTCARILTGGNLTLRCVGSDWLGQLGNDADDDDSGTMVMPSGMSTNAVQVVAGIQTLCALHNTTTKCWGSNYNSLLGHGTDYATEPSNGIPTTATGMTVDMTAVAIGQNHVCSLKLQAVWCWGSNGYGQSNGTPSANFATPDNAPITTTYPAYDALAVTDGSTCAIVITTNPTRAIRCFGRGVLGELGNGASSNSATPVTVIGSTGTGVTAPTDLAATDSTFCAIIGGSIKCWGTGAYGELGTGSFAATNTPVDVPGTAGATELDGYRDHFCAVIAGAVKCWGTGRNNVFANMTGYGVLAPTAATLINAALAPPPAAPIFPYVKQKIKATLKLNGKIKKSGRTKISVPLKLYFAAPAGSNAATVCVSRTVISVKTAKKKTTRLKVKFKRKGPNCSYTGKIKLPRSFKGKKIKFTVTVPTNADVLAYKSTKTLKLK